MTCLSPLEVDAYLDGELGKEQVDSFCGHLPGCEGCQQRLERAVHLKSMAFAAYAEPLPEIRPLPRPPPTPLAARPMGRDGRVARPQWDRRRIIGIVGAVLVPAAVVMMLVLHPSMTPTGEVAQSPLPGERRPIRGRLSYGPLDQYGPWSPVRSGEQHGTAVNLAEVVRGQKDPRSAPSHLLHALELDEAERQFQLLPESPERASDLSAVALARNAPAQALELATAALKRAPDMPQALWNRACALSDLRLSAEAAAAFGELAARNEKGWSAEAADMAKTAALAARERARRGQPPAGTEAALQARALRAQARAAMEAGDRARADQLLLDAVRKCVDVTACWD